MDISKNRRTVKQIKKYSLFLIRCDVEDISCTGFNEGEMITQKAYDSFSRELPALLSFLEKRDIYPCAPHHFRNLQFQKIYTKLRQLIKEIDSAELTSHGMRVASSFGILNL